MSNLVLAYVAGLVTILNPCVLPLLPILIGTALVQSKYGPMALTAGLVVSFAGAGLSIIAFGHAIGINEDAMRQGAAALLFAAGIILLLPGLQTLFTTATSPLVAGGNRMLERVSGIGNRGQFIIGVLLGLVWAPCVGPTLGVAIAAASRGEDLLRAFAIFFVFGLGVATSILVLAYGSRHALSSRRARARQFARYAKPIFGAALVLVGLFILTGFERQVETWVLDAMPNWLIRFTTRF